MVLLKQDKLGRLSYSGVFAEVYNYIDWINSIAGFSEEVIMFKNLETKEVAPGEIEELVLINDQTSNGVRNKNFNSFYILSIVVVVTGIYYILLY